MRSGTPGGPWEDVARQVARLGQPFRRAIHGFVHPPVPLARYRAGIDRWNAHHPNRASRDAVRSWNHELIDILNAIHPLQGATLVDVGASPYGYALERALDRGVGHYVGIGLGIAGPTRVVGPSGVGTLAHGDAAELACADESADAVLSLSTFEHVHEPDRALAEMHRVLRPGGVALLSFEPIWTCSYGHHLQTFGEAARSAVPDWAHLVWSKDEMQAALASSWPADAALTLDAALAWVYEEGALNRIGIRAMRHALESSNLNVAWLQPLADVPRDPVWRARAGRATGLTDEELQTKGFSALLRRQ